MTEINSELENTATPFTSETDNEPIELPEESDATQNTAEDEADPTPEETERTDYSEIIEADIKELRTTFAELRDLESISELKNPLRFAALRDLGLSATEAYLATSAPRPVYDNRAHLTASVPGSAGVATEMSRNEYAIARDLFTELSDSEIRKLYRKVTK